MLIKTSKGLYSHQVCMLVGERKSKNRKYKAMVNSVNEIRRYKEFLGELATQYSGKPS